MFLFNFLFFFILVSGIVDDNIEIELDMYDTDDTVPAEKCSNQPGKAVLNIIESII